MKRTSVLFFLVVSLIIVTNRPVISQSEAHDWVELLLEAIRGDLARPTVHARNLHHTSALMYDTWTVFNDADPYLLGNTIGNYTSEFEGYSPVGYTDEEAMIIALDYAAYRLIKWRFLSSPGAFFNNVRVDNYMTSKGYDIWNFGIDYQSGDPVQLGNYIYEQYQEFGLQDGAREVFNYGNAYYEPVNEPLFPGNPGNPNLINPNRWQPLTLSVFIDQGGNVFPGNTPEFLSPEWGNVIPFALVDPVSYERDGDTYQIYLDPGFPYYLDTIAGLGSSEEYEWGFSLVSKWQAHHDPSDGVMWDISPGASGNISVQDLPSTFDEYKDFYKLPEGGDLGQGRPLNPKTGQPYEPNIVPRGDYTRVLAEFWADGPDSETPPGHWFSLLSDINYHPELIRKFEGKGEELSQLEWDIKTYFTLGGAMHDAAVNTWGLKGYYDYIRPVSAIRYLAELGQKSDANLPNYHPAGIQLEDGYVELIEAGDALAGFFGEHIGKIKLYTWRGPDYIPIPEISEAGVGWIRAEDWWPYQRPSFVTPNFSGYVSGHSTFSRAAAEVLTFITGDEYFPGGMGVFPVEEDEFLVFENGPSVSFELQWATYRDASDQTSLSRIWGGIHPPVDDIPGRKIGIEIAEQVFDKAKNLFYSDNDNDGYYSYEDCNDNNANVNPGLIETCDGLDNDCNDAIDEGLTLYTYYADGDLDGYGDSSQTIETCATIPPEGYVDNTTDCDDTSSDINPIAPEICDQIDNNCSGENNEGLTYITYYRDFDNDGYGGNEFSLDTCIITPPIGYADNNDDCDDTDPTINPQAEDIADNGIDEDCSGYDLYMETKILVNPVASNLEIRYATDVTSALELYNDRGQLISKSSMEFDQNFITVPMDQLIPGIYWMRILQDGILIIEEKLVKI